MKKLILNSAIIYYTLIVHLLLSDAMQLSKKRDYVNVLSKLRQKRLVLESGEITAFCEPMAEVTNENLKDHRSVKVKGLFTNPWDTWKFPSKLDVLRWVMEKDNSNVPSREVLNLTLPIVKPEFSAEPPKDKIEITWIGHATVVVRFDNISIITDPIFSERASIVQFAGPKRFRSAACTVDELPHIDAVVISHNHYDHLDSDSVKDLNKRFGPNLHWFVPLEMSSWMRDAGCVNVIDMDWWSQSCISQKSDVKFVFTPAQHWSKRSVSDDNKVLWGSWAVIGPKHRFYFAGDTGYCPVFKEIGNVYGPFDLAAIPIGAYEPRWFMKSQHVDPEEAIKIHEDVKSQKSVGIHWGTFALAHEFYLEPKDKLKELLTEHKLPLESFITIPHGQTNYV